MEKSISITNNKWWNTSAFHPDEKATERILAKLEKCHNSLQRKEKNATKQRKSVSKS